MPVGESKLQALRRRGIKSIEPLRGSIQQSTPSLFPGLPKLNPGLKLANTFGVLKSPKFKARSSKPEVQSLKSKARSSKPEVQRPKPQTDNSSRCQFRCKHRSTQTGYHCGNLHHLATRFINPHRLFVIIDVDRNNLQFISIKRSGRHGHTFRANYF